MAELPRPIGSTDSCKWAFSLLSKALILLLMLLIVPLLRLWTVHVLQAPLPIKPKSK